MVRIAIGILILIILVGCPNFSRLGMSQIERGWSYYEDGEYDEAIDEFSSAIESDLDSLDHAEAFNGLGWCYGKIQELSTAVDDFSIAIEKDISIIDPYAGLTFVYSDIPQDQNAVDAATTLIQKDEFYFFGHDKDITVGDVRLVKAKSLCNLGNFVSALIEVRQLNPSFNCNVSTPDGREALLLEIERLRSII